MKKLATTIAAAFIMISSFSAFAADKNSPVKFVETNHLVSAYLAAAAAGDSEFGADLFATDFQFTNTANGTHFNKTSYTKFLKANKGIQYDCQSTYEVLDQSGKACLAKATMKFKKFTRVDYITLNKSAEGWKVSKVVSSYPQ